MKLTSFIKDSKHKYLDIETPDGSASFKSSNNSIEELK